MEGMEEITGVVVLSEVSSDKVGDEPPTKKKRGAPLGNNNNPNRNDNLKSNKHRSQKELPILEAMRLVLVTTSKKDTEQVHNLRKSYQDNKEAFLDRLFRLEFDERKVQQQAAKEKQGIGAGDRGGEEPLAPDETVADLRLLIDKMLDGSDAESAAVVAGGVSQEGPPRVAGEPGDEAADTG